jgi:hypothetical protein
MATQSINRNDEIKAIWKEYKFFYQILAGVVLVGIGVLIGMFAFSAPADRIGYLINLYTSILSILVTVFVIDFLNRRREEHRDLRQLQEQLVRDASSTSNETAKNAVHQVRKRGWLEGESSLLQEADFFQANLEGADLMNANLQGARLSFANLRAADLGGVNLEDAILFHAFLQGAYLYYANLQRAHLHTVDLQGAYLDSANLQRADLRNANIQKVSFTTQT